MPAHSQHTRFSVLGYSLLSLLTSLPLLAQSHPAIQTEARIDRAAIPLSGHLLLTFRVEGPKGLEVDKIVLPVTSPLWQVKPAGPAQAQALADGRSRWQQVFRLEPLQAGKAALPLAPIRYRVERGPWTEHTWKDLAIEVTTDVLDPRVEELRGTSRIEELPPVPGWPRWPLYAALLLAVSVGLVAWRRRRQREPAPAALPPREWALQELEAIERQGLPQAGAAERYHTLLSDVLRRYVERKHGLPATQQTTAEFLAALQPSPQLPAEAQVLLRDFLQRCDLAKFARAEYGPAECAQTAQLARQFIGQSA